jgi:hypothetical protein
MKNAGHMFQQLRYQHIGIVQHAQMLLQGFHRLERPAKLRPHSGVQGINVLEYLHRVAQTLGGDTHLVQFIDVIRVGEIRLKGKHLVQTLADQMLCVDENG